MTLLAEYLPDPAVGTTLIVIQTTNLMYIVPMTLSSYFIYTRVDNDLGALRPERVLLATVVALRCALEIGLINATWTALFKDDAVRESLCSPPYQVSR
ncbi:hypothetical protein SUGI_1096180 [Cryptomeria japonica]|nr:hypothetical protein SUGI_1096180 [Cryptomeria japonica]